jgi:uncharacterized protein DUF4397
MRRIFPLSVLCLAAGIVNACKPEEVILTEDIPTAGIRFINVVPDTFGMDFRPVDIVENSTFYNVNFRATSLLFYKNAKVGARHFRIFTSPPSTDDPPAVQQAIASTVIKDTTYTLVAGHRYTFILWGYARAGQTPGLKLDIYDDDPADPGSQVALRVLNACLPGVCGGSATGIVDVRQYPNGGVVPGTATWAAVAPQSATAYVLADTGSKRFNVQPAGGGAVLFADALGLTGTRASGPGGILCPPSTTGCDIDALPGTTVSGSAVTGIVVPRSVAGSKAASFTTPSMIFIWDRRPPRPAGI